MIPKHLLRSSRVSKIPNRMRAPSTFQNKDRNRSVKGLSKTNPKKRKRGFIKNKNPTPISYHVSQHGRSHFSKLQKRSSENNRRNPFHNGKKRTFKSVKKFHMNRTIKAYIPKINELLKVKFNFINKTGVRSVDLDDVTCTKWPLGQDPADLSHALSEYLTSSLVTILLISNAIKSDSENITENFDKNYKLMSPKENSQEHLPSIEDSIMSELCKNRNFHIKPQIYHVNLVELGRESPPATVQGMDWDSFKDEKFRIRSFLNYPTRAAKSALVLAENGFVYIGSGRNNDDTVICHFCYVKMRDWQPTDIVSFVHGLRSPNCSIITNINCENIPLASNSDFNYLLNRLNQQSDNFECSEMVRPPNMELETDCASDSSRRQHLSQKSTDIEADCAPETRRPRVSQQPADIEPGYAYDSRRPVSTGLPHPTGWSTQPNPTSNERTPNQTSTTSRFASLPESPVISQTPATHVPGAQASQKSQAPGNSSNLSYSTTSVSQRTSTTTQSQVPTMPSPTTRNSTPSLPQALPTSTNNAVASTTATTTTSSSLNSTAASTVTPAVGQTNPPGGTVTGQKDNKTGKGPTYAELGIMTERPKRPEYALRVKRFETFTNWPRHHHLKPEDLAGAGFYYAGYGDCARCFFCGGGLRNWEDEDDVWVEHARWFPKCAYIRQLMGPIFVEKVQELNKTKDQIPYSLVIESMGPAGAAFKPDTKENPWKRDPAVKTVLELGFYQEKDVLEIAEKLKNGASFLSADVLLKQLQDKPRTTTKTTASSSVPNTLTNAQDEEAIRQIKERNNQLRQQTVCKICMDKEVAVVFLPCGHLVSCSECGAAMKDCPVCRVNIKGVVRAFMS